MLKLALSQPLVLTAVSGLQALHLLLLMAAPFRLMADDASACVLVSKNFTGLSLLLLYNALYWGQISYDIMDFLLTVGHNV